MCTTSARHLVDVGSTESLRLLVHVVTADTLENGSNLQRFERLPLLKKGTLENSASHTSGQRKKIVRPHLIHGRVLRKHRVQHDVVGKVVDASVVLERDLQLRGSGAGSLCLKGGIKY